MATFTRTDIHCPSRIIPTDYTYVGIGTALRSGLGYHPFVIAEHNRIRAHMEQTGGTWASHEHGGSCMSCGAHATYLATFHHPKSNEYIRVGMDCAEKLGIGDVNRFRTFMKSVDAARHHLAGKRKALGLLQQRKMEGAWTLYLLLTDIPQATRGLGFTPETPLGILADFCEETGLEQGLVIRSLAHQLDKGASLTREQGIVLDMVRKLVKYGSLSERQWSYLSSLLATVEGKTPTPQAPVPTPAPVPQSPTLRTLSQEEGDAIARLFLPRIDSTIQDRTLSPEERALQLTRINEEYTQAVRRAQETPAPRTFGVITSTGRERSVTTSRTNDDAISICSRMSDNFAQDLARQYRERGLSHRQMSWVHVLAEESEVARREEQQRASQVEAIVTADTEGGVEKIVEMLTQAKARLDKDTSHKHHPPKIRLVVLVPCSNCNGEGTLPPEDDGTVEECMKCRGIGKSNFTQALYVLSIATRGRHPGWINVTSSPTNRGDVELRGREYVGQISTDGILHPAQGVDLSSHPGLVEQLRRFAADPETVAKEFGKLTGRCCFCNKELTDPRSTEMGWGERCSENYGLPWGKERRPQTPPPAPQPAPVPVPEVPSLPRISTRVLSYSHSDRTFSVSSPDLGLPDPFPQVIEVESSRTGNVLPFRLSSRNYEGGELTSVDYDSPDGEFSLRIHN